MRVRRLAVGLLVCGSLAMGCGWLHRHAAAPAAAAHGPTALAYTDSTAVSALAATPAFLLAASGTGVDRFDLRTGAVVHIDEADGLIGRAVIALAVDPDGAHAWIATRDGLSRLEVATGRVAPIPVGKDAAAAVGAVLAGLEALAADGTGGVWIAGAAGLHHVDAAGAWRAVSPRPVARLLPAAGGDLWLAGPDGLALRHASGAVDSYGAAQGVAVPRVIALVAAADGAPVLIGADVDRRRPSAHLLIAVRVAAGGAPAVSGAASKPADAPRFATYRTPDKLPILGAARRGGEIVLATPTALYTLVSGDSSLRRRSGIYLDRVAGAEAGSPVVIAPLELPEDQPLPPDPTVFASAPDGGAAPDAGELFVGTRRLGTARLFDPTPAEAGKRRSHWLRSRDLVAGARAMTVACAAPRECYVATGTERAWRWDGESFTRAPITGPPGTVTLAVMRAPDGKVLALTRGPDEHRLHVARLGGGAFAPIGELAIETPGGVTTLTFAKFGPDGLLWLGLTYLDAEHERRPYGVATVDLTVNAVSYHHQVAGNDSRKTGVLPVPNDVADIAFLGDDETWLATASGAARVKWTQPPTVTLFGEVEGLESEILHGVVVTDGGLVFVASTRGVGQFDGQHWSFPVTLKLAARALSLGKDGRLWMGTDHGLVAYDGQRLTRIGRAGGLLEDRIEDVAIDSFGRIWARSAQGISIVTP